MNQSSPDPAASRAEQEEMRVGWKMAGIGMQVGTEVIAGCILGWLFDKWRGHGNIGLIIGAATGIAVGMWSLIKNTLKLNKQLELTAPTKGRGKPIPPPQQDQRPGDWHDDDQRDNWDNHEDDDWKRTPP